MKFPPNFSDFSFDDKLAYIASCQVIRNGKVHEDGSLGEIKISPKEMHELVQEVRRVCDDFHSSNRS